MARRPAPTNGMLNTFNGLVNTLNGIINKHSKAIFFELHYACQQIVFRAVIEINIGANVGTNALLPNQTLDKYR